MALADGDSAAINTVRRAFQSRLAVDRAPADSTDNTLALFDKGVAALKEAKAADGALSQRSAAGATLPVDSSDLIRDHKALGELYQFGQNLGMTPVGSEAQALALIVASDRFLAVRDLSARDKSLAAEPLFSVIFNVPVPAPTGGRTAPTWNQYLSAAARSVSKTSPPGTRGGVGGGPAPATDERSNLRDVARATEDRMRTVAEHLPQSSDLRGEVEEIAVELRTFDAPAGSSRSGGQSTSGSSDTKSNGVSSGTQSGGSGTQSGGSTTPRK